MSINFLIITGIISTSIMALFSYLYAQIRPSEFFEFKEPELLDLLIKNPGEISSHPSKINLLGWILYYIAGVFFVLVFEFLLKIDFVNFSLVICAVYGILIGSISIFIWLSLFYLNGYVPKIKYREFSLHLLLARLIFSISMGGIYITFK